MKIFLTIIIFFLMSFNSLIASENLNNTPNNINNMIDCSAKAIIKYVPIKGLDNSSLMYAVLINHKEKKYQLISDKNNNIKCIFN